MHNPQNIAFAIITFYPGWYRGKTRSLSHTDKIRGDLALEFIQKTISLNYQLVITDGYSSKSFRRELKKFSGIKIIKRRSNKRSFAKRQAFKTASQLPEVKVVIATEPEKVSLIDSTDIIAKPLLENASDILILKREKQLFQETYPDYMHDSEVEGNRIYNQELRLHSILPEKSEDLDWFFGPRAFRNDRKIISLFIKKPGFKIGNNELFEGYFDSDVSFFPLVLALKKGFRLKNLQIPFAYPKMQKMNESFGARDFFIKKREAQRLGILLELMQLLDYLKNK